LCILKDQFVYRRTSECVWKQNLVCIKGTVCVYRWGSLCLLKDQFVYTEGPVCVYKRTSFVYRRTGVFIEEQVSVYGSIIYCVQKDQFVSI
jgi:hypothetical protein